MQFWQFDWTRLVRFSDKCHTWSFRSTNLVMLIPTWPRGCSNVSENMYVGKKTFTDMQLLKCRNVAERYVGEYVWNRMLVFSLTNRKVFTNIHLNFCLQQHTASPTFRKHQHTFFQHISPTSLQPSKTVTTWSFQNPCL